MEFSQLPFRAKHLSFDDIEKKSGMIISAHPSEMTAYE